MKKCKNLNLGLLAKAAGIANGIISRLRKAFDEHSPSKKTRKIMKFAMQPMEEEMEAGKKELFKQADEIGNGITRRLGNLNSNINVDSNSEQKLENQKAFNIEMDYNKMAKAFLSALNSSEAMTMLNKIIEKKNNTKVVLDTGILVGETKDAFDTELANNQTRRKRGN